MYSRFQAENFFVTTVSADCTLTPGVDGVIPVQDVPQIEVGKLFYVIFKIDDKSNRFSLPVFLDNNRQMCYKGYNVTENHELKKYDTVGLNDLAENFNYLFNNIDDIGTIVKKGGLDILVYGGIIVNGGSALTVADTTITLEDNATSHIIFDFSDNTIKAVSELADFGQYYFAEVTTLGGIVTDVTLKKSFNVGEFFSANAFDRDENGAIILKDGSVTKSKMDLTGVTADDIDEGTEHLLMTPEERQTLVTVDSKSHTHSNKTILDTITDADRTKLNNTTGVNSGDETQASIKTKLGAASASQDGYITKEDFSDLNNKKHTHTNKAVLDSLTAGDKAKLDAISGTNTGDETQASIKTKLGAASAIQDGYITKEDFGTFNSKQDAIADLNDIRAGAAAGSTALQPGDMSAYEQVANKKTSLANPDNNSYPTTKAVADAIQQAGGGDMLASTYDPNNVGGDAFDMDNMADGTNKHYITTAQQTILNNTSGTNTGDQSASDFDIKDLTDSTNKMQSWDNKQDGIDSSHKLSADVVDDTSTVNKFVSASEKNTWNGKQDAIDSSHKLSADMVDDTNSSNKFVSASDKNTWNGKQDVIDASHKLSADVVDDTSATNKFVTSSEKSTWNGKQNAIDNSHKLDADLIDDTNSTNKLTTATEKSTWNGKQDAINSGNKLSADNVSNGTNNRLAYVGNSAPSTPAEGDLWYDTVNSKLKTYDGVNWNAAGAGTGDVTGPSSATDSHVALFDGATGKLLKDGGALPTPTVVSGDAGVTYTMKSGTTKPASGTPITTITIVLDS